MPKTIEYFNHGVREVYSKEGYHSCWDCEYCVDMVAPDHYMCKSRGLSSHRDIRFPYDNTKCGEFKLRNDKA